MQSFIESGRVVGAAPTYQIGRKLAELDGAARALGLHGAGYAFWNKGPGQPPFRPGVSPRLGMHHSFSQGRWIDWLTQYIADQCAQYPVFCSVRNSVLPVWWGEDLRYKKHGTTESFSQSQIDAFALCYERTGIRAGIAVPVRGPNGSEGYMSFLSETPLSTLYERRQEIESAILPASLCAFNALKDSLDPVLHRPHLSPREVQMMSLVAEGLTMEQSARRLGISATTVRYHIDNAVQKLEARSRSEAVMLLSAYDLYEPQGDISPQN